MFERFTDRARRVVVLAQEEARLLNHNYIGTEHILLGLIHEGEGVAANALESLGISLEAVRAEVEGTIGRGTEPPDAHIPFTPRAKKVLELSLREAMTLGHNYIGTEHILLGLIREGEGVAAQVLIKLGADLERVRQQVIQVLSGYVGGSLGEQAPPGPLRISRQAVTAGIAGGPGVYLDEPAELVRVVPLAREVFQGQGLRIVLVSLEIWSGWLDLRYAVLSGDEPPGSSTPDITLDWRVADDAGTTYELCGLAGSGARLLRMHQVSFMPAPATDARKLTLTAADADGTTLAAVEIELAPEP
jgi:phage shock protein PspC (stress-responsive transcriptional regulator)